jgi:methylated-DNA-[protein]-cysteine S-methyltransferase
VEIHRGHLDVDGFSSLWLSWSERGLVAIDWTRPTFSQEEPRESEIPAIYRTVLKDYFCGKDVDPIALPADLRGTDFQIKVWQELRRIPRGSVRSYGDIAFSIGSPRAARAVGAANRANPLPIVVPCHRVIKSGSRLGGYSGGLERKRFLLRLEGIRVDSDVVRPNQSVLL